MKARFAGHTRTGLFLFLAVYVGVLVALLAMGDGFQATLKQTGSDDTAIVMRAGSQADPQTRQDTGAQVHQVPLA